MEPKIIKQGNLGVESKIHNQKFASMAQIVQKCRYFKTTSIFSSSPQNQEV
jgi:hypothetical protein